MAGMSFQGPIFSLLAIFLLDSLLVVPNASPAEFLTRSDETTTSDEVTTAETLATASPPFNPTDEQLRLRNITKHLHEQSMSTVCEFNPNDDLSQVKILSTLEELLDKSMGWTIEVDCIDGVLRKPVQSDSLTATCRSHVVTNDDGFQILKLYWDLSAVHQRCGKEPLCTLVGETYNYPVLLESSSEPQLVEEIPFNHSDGSVEATFINFYPVGTSQTFNVSDDACGNDSLTVSENTTYALCEAPEELDILREDDDPEEIRTHFWYFNYGLWTLPPPECKAKTCSPPDRSTLGLSSNDVFSSAFDSYSLGETVVVSCAEGETQINMAVTNETISCVLDENNEAVFQREQDTNLRMDLCSVKTCNLPPLSLLGFGEYAEYIDVSGSYNLGETVDVRCMNGSLQNTSTVNVETLTCLPEEGLYFMTRPDDTDMRLTLCEPIRCPIPENITMSVAGDVSADAQLLGTQALVSCPDINFEYQSNCVEQDTPSTVGRWVPTPTCRSKTCWHFMSDANIYEYELLYGRHIVGEPGPIELNDTLTFVCPKGTVAYMRNELTYQCRLSPNGLGHFEPLEWGVKPDCRQIRCPRNDTSTGVYFDPKYPYFDRKCFEQGECKEGALVTHNCSDTEANFTPIHQCVMADDAPVLAMNESQLEIDMLSGVWFPPPVCERGCAAPVNISGNMDCTVRRKFDVGEWNFGNEYVIQCICKRGYIRDDGSLPEASCDGSNGTWIPTKPCHVDCDPIPTIPHATHNVSYHGIYALMNIECDSGYQFMPTRDALAAPVTSRCYHGDHRWLNLHLFECVEIDGCKSSDVTSTYSDVYLSPGKTMFDENEVALARCNRGYLESESAYEVLVCRTVWKEVPNNKTWAPVPTTMGEAADVSQWTFFPNVTMKFVGYEWDYSNLRGNLTCEIDPDQPLDVWEVEK